MPVPSNLALTENEILAIESAGAGGIPDYAKQARREGGSLQLDRAQMAEAGAGGQQDCARQYMRETV